METAVAQKKESKKKSQPVTEALAENSSSLENVLGSSAGIPLFLQRSPSSSGASTVQPKLTVSHPQDAYEQEANRVATQVMQMSDAQEQESAATQQPIFRVPTPQILHRAGESYSEKELLPSDTTIEHRLAERQGQGNILDANARSFMEKRFGYDFGNVKIHTDSEAAQMNRALHAQAFTHKNNIYFDTGKYTPDSGAGKILLAHELTHVVQQTGGIKRQVEIDTLKSEVQEISPITSNLVATALIQREDPDASAPPPILSPNPSSVVSDTDLSTEARQQILAASVTLRRVQPLTEDERSTLSRTIPGASVLMLIQQRDQKRTELQQKTEELERIRPEHGTPMPGSAEEQRINTLTQDVATLNPEIDRLDGMVQASLRVLNLEREEDLVELVGTQFPRLFIERSKLIAKAELDQNKEIVEQEAQRYGLNMCVDPSARQGLVTSAQDLRNRERQIQQLEQQIQMIRSTVDLPSAGVPDPSQMNSSYYDYLRIPQIQEEISRLIREREQQHQIYVLQYPVLLQNPDLEAIASGDEERFNSSVSNKIQPIIDNIEMTKQNIDSGRLKIWNLRNIVEMTSLDLAVDSSPVLQAAIANHVREEQTDEAVLNIALTALSITAGIIATVATGGVALAAGIVLSVGGIYQASESVRNYLAESAASSTALDPQLADISRGEPELAWVILDLVGVILDVAEVIRLFNLLRTSARALRMAEGLAEFANVARRVAPLAADRLISNATRQALRQATQDVAMQVGFAMLSQMFLDEGSEENDELLIDGIEIDLSAPSEETAVTPKLIQRSWTPLPSWVPTALPKGDVFEGTVAGMLRRGKVPGLPKMDHLIQGKYNRSGHGIDFIGIKIRGNRLYVYRIEVKGGIAPRVHSTLSGTQTGRGWTLNAIDRILGNEQITNLLMNRLNITDPSLLRTRLRRAPSFIIAHSSAYLGALGRRLGGLRSRGGSYAPELITVGRGGPRRR